MNGLAWSDVPPTDGFCDASPPEGRPGLLVGFFESREARNWNGRPREERKKLIVDRIASLLGTEGANPIDYQDWPSEIWSRGCYGGFMGPGVMTTVGKSIRVPHGRIHWAAKIIYISTLLLGVAVDPCYCNPYKQITANGMAFTYVEEGTGAPCAICGPWHHDENPCSTRAFLHICECHPVGRDLLCIDCNSRQPTATPRTNALMYIILVRTASS